MDVCTSKKCRHNIKVNTINRKPMFTTEQVVARFIEKHKNLYTYERYSYTRMNDKGILTCSLHGDFYQSPTDHLKGNGCPECAIEGRRISSDAIIKRIKDIHGDLYIYPELSSITRLSKIDIECKVHGKFTQGVSKHLQGQGCPRCGVNKQTKTRSMTYETFVKKSKEVHGDFYSYPDTNLINTQTKIGILCPLHGYFYQIPNTHLQGGGCPKCKNDKNKALHTMTYEEFVKKAKTIHGDTYSYDKVRYLNNHTKVEIVCSVHGSFWQIPSTHLRGGGCRKCAIDKRRPSVEEFIERANIVHNGKYTYPDTNYPNMTTKITILCPKHGPFRNTPSMHLQGLGCPTCKSSRGEIAIKSILDKHNITYSQQWWYPNSAELFRYDFYLPEQNVIIEFHGAQHYTFIRHFHRTEEGFENRKRADIYKLEMAKTNQIPFIEFKNIQPKQLVTQAFENIVLHVVERIKNYAPKSRSPHLLVEYNREKDKYYVKFVGL